MEQILKIKKMRPGAEVPQRATEGAAGLDLRACIDAPVTLAPGGLAMIPSGIAVSLPGSGYAAFVFAPRLGSHCAIITRSRLYRLITL